ncbi:uncharacterized protein LOC113324211 [Papaver somniferum]|uniref:uncharacterized protein LOC113324211 n=1 Tax=Papaver somniferum TaxID=3469 RepID=UPI000E7021D0|nr:uncharacterized protein LOC113324211 [Papaver somniferum]
MLKDKEEWIKGETFDIQIKDREGLLPDTFRCCTDAITTSTAITLPTRLLTFSDQVLLYWFDGDCLVFYNLQTKHLKVVKGAPATLGIQDDDNMYCTYMDYQLHAQVENFQSLKTFIPVEKSFKFKGFADICQFITKKKLEAGTLITGREKLTYKSTSVTCQVLDHFTLIICLNESNLSVLFFGMSYRSVLRMIRTVASSEGILNSCNVNGVKVIQLLCFGCDS